MGLCLLSLAHCVPRARDACAPQRRARAGRRRRRRRLGARLAAQSRSAAAARCGVVLLVFGGPDARTRAPLSFKTPPPLSVRKQSMHEQRARVVDVCVDVWMCWLVAEGCVSERRGERGGGRRGEGRGREGAAALPSHTQHHSPPAPLTLQTHRNQLATTPLPPPALQQRAQAASRTAILSLGRKHFAGQSATTNRSPSRTRPCPLCLGPANPLNVLICPRARSPCTSGRSRNHWTPPGRRNSLV